MKRFFAALVLTTTLSVPAVVLARPLTLTAALNSYGGNGAYLAFYVTDAKGAYVDTLWVSGRKTKYYKHLTDWYRATGGKSAKINGITGASVGAGKTLKVTVELADALLDAGYTLHVDAAAEDMRDSPRELSLPLTTAGAGKAVAGKRYVATLRYGL
jgi:Predicted periplasmic protein (DUF2271)